MKIVFIGPSLPDATQFATTGTRILPPAEQGDVYRAVSKGAAVIGIVDGLFEHVAPVWHKEILYALTRGCSVLGASSMGALRAVECAPYGMMGIGRIFEEYRDGIRVDDGDVALQHGPKDIGYAALTVPLVNVDATLANAQNLGLLSSADANHLASVARSIFFKQRTWRRIVQQAELSWDDLQPLIKRSAIDQKRLDAIELIRQINGLAAVRNTCPDWIFNETQAWRELEENMNNPRFIRSH
ncbi:TfuA-like protein [Rhizobium helianthi]|uniref:TfuA-like protein n=1 Tax=Rhizobium helianthi TaxID=1132695 RepID=A0ABW4M9M7_9HYPH